MSYTLIRESEPVARKQYRCVWCGEPILKGEKHYHEISHYDELQDHRWHSECIVDARDCFSDGDDTFTLYSAERPANKATPEELDRIAEFAARQIDEPYDLHTSNKDIIRSAIDQALALAAADLIESEANTSLAVKNSKLRILLGDLVEAVDRTEDLDETDGPQFALAMTELEAALSQARPYTEEGLIESLQKNRITKEPT